MHKYAVQHEMLIWFQKPGGERTYNAEEGVEHYAEEDRAVALAKGVGRVTNASLDRGRPPRSFLDFARENSRSKERQHGTHPSMKPLGLCAHLVKLHSNPWRPGACAVCGLGLRAALGGQAGTRGQWSGDERGVRRDHRAPIRGAWAERDARTPGHSRVVSPMAA